jgi:hypothetical protein
VLSSSVMRSSARSLSRVSHRFRFLPANE